MHAEIDLPFHLLWLWRKRGEEGKERIWIRDLWKTQFYFLAFCFLKLVSFEKGFPVSSVGKESICNSGDPGLIPGLGRSTGEGIGYPLQYSWASPVAQLVKNPPAMWETWVQSLGWEDLLEKGKATHSSILTWRIPWTVLSTGSRRVRHEWATFTFILSFY